MRKYRRRITTQGQSSPAFISLLTSDLLGRFSSGKEVRVLDVGCGTGEQISRIKQRVTFPIIASGVDWSPATVEYHQSPTSPYAEVSLCDASRLPFRDGHFDVALSMENIEHLYSDGVGPSIQEMARVAQYVLISTPLPGDLINFDFLESELHAAINDSEPLSLRDYNCLESAVHKSCVLPSSLASAGFVSGSEVHGIFFAESRVINHDQIKVIGLQKGSVPPTASDYRYFYLRLLADSAALHFKLEESGLVNPPARAAISRRKTLRERVKRGIRSLVEREV